MKIEEFLTRLNTVRQSGHGWMARCPAHDDTTPSLSVATGSDGRILVKCQAGCPTESVLATMGLTMRDLFQNTSPSGPGLTVAALAKAKGLDPQWLKTTFGLEDAQPTRTRPAAVRIPYRDENGQLIALRFRLALAGERRFVWRNGDHVHLYGLWKFATFRAGGWVLLVEGESDVWTGWMADLPILGIPGKDAWQPGWAGYFQGSKVYVWREPGAESLVSKIAADIPDLLVIPAPDGIKDLSEAHLQGQDVSVLVERLKGRAIPAAEILRQQREAELAELQQQAAPVLAAMDPLELVETEVRRIGYGGDVRPALTVYIAAASRLLRRRRGTMPAHILVVSAPGAGKSYTVDVVAALHPSDAFHRITAGSARALIYDQANLEHRALVFGEADSLPKGEDNPAASAMRALLQDGELSYDVVLKDPRTGEFETMKIRRPGPTILITTSTRRLPPQMDSRVFTLEIPDDRDQVRKALDAQAAMELTGTTPEPNSALVAYQALLQALAPWDVAIPFATRLAQAIGKSESAPRILRDFARLMSLVKAVAILRYRHRQRDAHSRLVATLADYETVRTLIGEMYEMTVTAASDKVRAVVAAVEELSGTQKSVTEAEIACHLGISPVAAHRRVKIAIQNGWLVNQETRKYHRAKLSSGEPLPDRCSLPRSQDLEYSGEATFLSESEENSQQQDGGDNLANRAEDGESGWEDDMVELPGYVLEAWGIKPPASGARVHAGNESQGSPKSKRIFRGR